MILTHIVQELDVANAGMLQIMKNMLYRGMFLLLYDALVCEK